MARAAELKNMDVDELLALRGDVEAALKEQARDLERQIALLDGGNSTGQGKRRGRPAGGGARASALKGKSVPPKYRGPGGETWAGRGATPRWLKALLDEGHSIEEFLIGARRKGKPAAIKKKVMKKKVAKPARKPRRPKKSETKAEPMAA
ncbi:MAG: H-NS family nucleoid-associated regulatory protein [Rhodoplanes sp.]